MKVTRAQAADNRRRVVAQASRLFRENGVASVGVSELMKASGLTHGGFYKQFASKEALVAEACRAALDHTFARWQAWLPEDATRRDRFMSAYLSKRHVDEAGDGCLLPALAAEAQRHGPEVRAVFSDAINAYATLLAPPREGRDMAGEERGGDDRPTSDDRSRAMSLAALSQLAGAVLLARAVDDPALRAELLDAAGDALGVRTGVDLVEEKDDERAHDSGA